MDWPTDDDGNHPLTDLVLADFLVVDLTMPYVEHGSFLEIELAARRGQPHQTCGGRTLNDDVMDVIFTQLVNAGRGPTIRDGVDAATHPATATFPYLAPPNPHPPEPPSTTSESRHPTAMPEATSPQLELDDIQAGALFERPSPYVGTYVLLRIADRADGRELVARLHRLATAARTTGSGDDTSITVAFSYHGLEALGVPQESLDSFAPEFREGMAARAALLGDVGESGPEHWEAPLGSSDVHVAIAVLSPDAAAAGGCRREGAARAYRAAGAGGGLAPGLLPARHGEDLLRLQGRHRSARRRRQREARPPTLGRGRSRPARSSWATPTRPVSCRPCRRRTSWAATAPTSSSASSTRRWPPTGATCATGRRAVLTRTCSARRWSVAGRAGLRSPSHRTATTPTSAPMPLRNNDFAFADDPRGFKCPVGAHARRANPRDALDQDGSVDVRLHRMIRRGTSYGPMLPAGVLEDDGADRGIVFVFAGAHLKRQFEFVKTQWLNDGIFIGAPLEKDPLVGPNDGSSGFTIPSRPIRRKLQDLPPFVVTRGGEYFFAPA